MNREIIFRGKRTDNGEWIEGDLVHYGSLTSIRVFVSGSFQKPSEYIVDPATVGQFTGLHDKDSKRIFEGDVLRYGLYFSVVVFTKPDDAICDFYGWGELSPEGIDVLATTGICVVFGNIHDNPELLNQ